MESTISLKTTLSHRFGQTVMLPIVGEKTFTEEGIIEVTEEEAKELVAMEGAGLSYITEQESIVEEKVVEEKVAAEEKTQLTVQELLKMSKEDLTQLASEAAEPEDEEWKKLNKKDLAEFIIDKLNK